MSEYQQLCQRGSQEMLRRYHLERGRERGMNLLLPKEAFLWVCCFSSPPPFPPNHDHGASVGIGKKTLPRRVRVCDMTVSTRAASLPTKAACVSYMHSSSIPPIPTRHHWRMARRLGHHTSRDKNPSSCATAFPLLSHSSRFKAKGPTLPFPLPSRHHHADE